MSSICALGALHFAKTVLTDLGWPRNVKGDWGDPSMSPALLRDAYCCRLLIHRVECFPQKGIVSYGLAQNRQRPFAGALHAAFTNTFRRTRGQILYWAIPVGLAYYVMEWAEKR